MQKKFSRRAFVRFVGATGAALFAGMSDLIPEAQLRWPAQARSPSGSSGIAYASPLSVGELYAGFILLPDGAPVPAFVKPSRRGIPDGCGVGRADPKIVAVIKSFARVEDVASEGRFPVYTFSKLPDGLRPRGGNLIKHPTGEVAGASIDFETYHAGARTWACTVSIWAQPDYPKPFPLWSQKALGPGGPAVVLEKVNFLPSPGIRVSTLLGCVFHWIQDEVCYRLRLEHSRSPQEIQALVSSLKKVVA